MPDQQNILVIIPLIAGREDHFQRTINAMFRLGYEGSILAIRGKGIKASHFQNPHLMITSKTYNLNGMASIFQAIELESQVIKQFQCAAYCDDDNLINPSFLEKAVKFLQDHEHYAGCNGRRFLCSQSDHCHSFLGQYASQYLDADTETQRLGQYCQQGGILFYAVVRSKVFLESLLGVASIQDDNSAEILLNYRLPKFGKFVLLPEIQLARPYPRPTIFNIPEALTWLQSDLMHPSLIRCIDMLISDYGISSDQKRKNDFFKTTIGHYLQLRFYGVQPNTIAKSCKPITNFCFRVLHRKAITKMLNAFNDYNWPMTGLRG